MTPSTRPSWDETRIAMARELAKRSLCSRDQVGAVIVDAQQKVIGEGYNGPPRAFKHANKPCVEWCDRAKRTGITEPSEVRDFADRVIMTLGPAKDYSDCPSLHAEANALMMSDRSLRAGGIMYVTSH